MQPLLKFSWLGLLVAPIGVPLVLSAFIVGADYGAERIPDFLLFFVGSCAFSYAMTGLVFLPCLSLLARFVRPSAILTGGLGLVLGLLDLLPVALVDAQARGGAAGPPGVAFFSELCLNLGDPASLLFPLGGLSTALLYWFLARQ